MFELILKLLMLKSINSNKTIDKIELSNSLTIFIDFVNDKIAKHPIFKLYLLTIVLFTFCRWKYYKGWFKKRRKIRLSYNIMGFSPYC